MLRNSDFQEKFKTMLKSQALEKIFKQYEIKSAVEGGGSTKVEDVKPQPFSARRQELLRSRLMRFSDSEEDRTQLKSKLTIQEPQQKYDSDGIYTPLKRSYKEKYFKNR